MGLQELENKAMTRTDLQVNGGDLKEMESQQSPHNSNLRYIILDLSAVSSMDASGVQILHNLLLEYKEREIQLCLSGTNDNVLELLDTSNVASRIGSQHMFMDNHD